MNDRDVVTLAQLAARLGCHKSTVSLALRGHRRISAKTADRVRRMAEELGYRPDPALARLSSLRWNGRDARPAVSVALVVGSRRDYPRIRGVIEPATERWVRGAGYGFERLFLEDYPSGLAASRVLRARGVGGLIAMASAEENGLARFPWDDWPVAQVLEGAGNLAHASAVCSDDFGAVVDGGRRLEEIGPESAAVCLLGQERPSRSDEHVLAAAMLVTASWRRAGINCDEPRVFRATPSGDGLKTMAAWLAQTRPGAAIVANSAVGARLGEWGVRPGLDMRLLAIRVLGARGWAGYERDIDAICEAAARRVDWMIRHGRRGWEERPELVLVPNVWRDGATWDSGRARG